ncbi:MAG: hypothetical protein NTX88_08385 [Candidatus Atribacteria bacterium]|nr:hypothetical protein [Candidatus Atribacteria bacterium]
MRGGLFRDAVVKKMEFWGKHFGLEIPLQKCFTGETPISLGGSDLKRFPAMRRDISLLVDDSTSWMQIHHELKELTLTHQMLIEQVELFDCFRGDNIPEGKKGFSFMIIFRSDERTLKDKEVDHWIQIIKNHLRKVPGVVLREDLVEFE